jgi:CYTH domain-containing protein
VKREIERKFLVRSSRWREGARGVNCRQGYLSTDVDRTVRVRVIGDRAFLTVKGRSAGCVRAEYEYPIPVEDATYLLENLCLLPLVEKVRFSVEFSGRTWVVDVFSGENEGLVLAEVELEDLDETVEMPEWAGEEVTGDPRFANASLVACPYVKW